MWILHLKRLILENHPAKIPAKVRAARLLTAPSLFTDGINTDFEWEVLNLSLPHSYILSQSYLPFLTCIFFLLTFLISPSFIQPLCCLSQSLSYLYLFADMQVEIEDFVPEIKVTEKVQCDYFKWLT